MMTTDAIGQYQPAAADLPGRPDSAKAASPSGGNAPTARSNAKTTEPALSQETLNSIAKDLQQSLSKTNTGLQFSVDNSTGKTVVRVVHEQSGEVIRQIPSEEMLAIARNIGRMQGLLLEKKV